MKTVKNSKDLQNGKNYYDKESNLLIYVKQFNEYLYQFNKLIYVSVDDDINNDIEKLDTIYLTLDEVKQLIF